MTHAPQTPENPFAFPDALSREHFGMTLRDYFAARAPISMTEYARHYLAEIDDPNDPFILDHTMLNNPEFLALWAGHRYAYADAMLKARENSVQLIEF